MLLPLGALELSDKVQTYGAYAGFASVLGLAVLSLLYFGQARELRRLREWAGRAPERAAELQERVQSEAASTTEAAKRVIAQPAARPAAATSAAQAASAAAAKSAPAPAAPAVAAVPAANPGAPGALSVPPSTAAGAAAASATPAPAASPSATPGGAPAPAQAGTPAPKPADGEPAAPATTPPVDQPTVVQGGLGRPGGPASAPPASSTPPASPKPTGPAPTGGGTGELVLPPVHPTPAAQESGETAVPLRRVSAGAALPPRPGGGGGSGSAGGSTSGGGGSRGPGGPFAVVAGIVAVLVIGAVVATQLIGGDEEPTRPNAITAATIPAETADQDRPRETTNTTRAPEVARGNVSVAVLNGTTITGLARDASLKIESTGYKITRVGDNSVQTVQASSVQFVDGSRRAAEDVAKIVGISASALAPMDPGTRVVAGDEAAVVVIVGADKSQ